MADPAVRLLRLLSLLQEHAVWSGPELAARLDVSVRGVRRDVERLRELGYPVRSERGVGGGYRLAAGKAMPPLLLDDDEAVAVAVSLSTAAGGTVEGVGEASLRALAKLDQVVPTRLRDRIAAVRTATVRLDVAGPAVASAALTGLARGCRDHQQVRFDYTDAQGERTGRRVEPYRLVATGRRWYLFAWDLDRADWRVFRVDRVEGLHVTTFRFSPREAPDAAERVARGVSHDAYRHQARVRVLAPAARVRAELSSTAVQVEEVGVDACLLLTGADHLGYLSMWLGLLEWELEVLDPPELRAEMRRLGARLAELGGGRRGPGYRVTSTPRVAARLPARWLLGRYAEAMGLTVGERRAVTKATARPSSRPRWTSARTRPSPCIDDEMSIGVRQAPTS